VRWSSFPASLARIPSVWQQTTLTHKYRRAPEFNLSFLGIRSINTPYNPNRQAGSRSGLPTQCTDRALSSLRARPFSKGGFERRYLVGHQLSGPLLTRALKTLPPLMASSMILADENFGRSGEPEKYKTCHPAVRPRNNIRTRAASTVVQTGPMKARTADGHGVHRES
jgi:hypothetical protein